MANYSLPIIFPFSLTQCVVLSSLAGVSKLSAKGQIVNVLGFQALWVTGFCHIFFFLFFFCFVFVQPINNVKTILSLRGCTKTGLTDFGLQVCQRLLFSLVQALRQVLVIATSYIHLHHKRVTGQLTKEMLCVNFYPNSKTGFSSETV